MSIAFGIALESEKWMQSLPENFPSQNLTIRGVWEKLEEIAEENGLTKLSHFLIDDPEYYEEALEAAEELDNPERDELMQKIQESLQQLSRQPDWFSSTDADIAIRTMQKLVESLQINTNLFTHLWTHNNDESVAVIIQDLERFASFLSKVKSRNIRFKFWME
ncbi:hypothetical protein NIES2135_33000 [Leptolyngbya boryana NIES-2135]|uniref:Uncharacterized protein n=1 Tax=Leptolyngbya boryana NIES-2135 TaxID=1973484 RepID=A0A1Z4JIC5_LEPBY|nr:hypothetical protein [Leptolyngbya boryana]ULP27620.1 hypothetical protein MCP04_16430 [Leptolyngbya boryana IU 594]BAS57343.1 hypothetical protein LBWT_32970 [Leptolyngbya boryana IAM M-101]BAS63691.1 hypothetical protein LBDG_32970 [Leptolyngbya boryana dg5]BAY56466.1 hypothetical protein NIES2135_33000 [Leptolyngbya boryana NIES-2135]